MEMKGKIIRVLPMRQGTSQRGQWKSQTYVLETEEMYPKHLAFDVFDGESGRIARLNIQEGKTYTVYFDIDAREHEGRWYNQIRAFDAREV